MRHTVPLLVLPLFLVLCCCGCGGKGSVTKESVKKVKAGMTEGQVARILGDPTNPADSAKVYRPATPDPNLGFSECVVVFSGGKVDSVMTVTEPPKKR